MFVFNPSEVHVWFRKTASLSAEVVNSAGSCLSADERARRDRYRFDADRRQFTLAHELLRRALSYYHDVSPADWRFTTNEYGKPLIDMADAELRKISFSLSHTSGRVACGITNQAAIGVDVERTDRSLESKVIAERYFSAEETAWLNGCSDETSQVRFVELWTLKEAFLKAAGVGLSGSLDSISFSFRAPNRIDFKVSSNFDPGQWHFALFDLGSNVRLGLAAHGGDDPHFVVREDGTNSVPVVPSRFSQ